MEKMEADHNRQADPAELMDWHLEMPRARAPVIKARIEESKDSVPKSKLRKQKQKKKPNKAVPINLRAIIKEEPRKIIKESEHSMLAKDNIQEHESGDWRNEKPKKDFMTRCLSLKTSIPLMIICLIDLYLNFEELHDRWFWYFYGD